MLMLASGGAPEGRDGRRRPGSAVAAAGGDPGGGPGRLIAADGRRRGDAGAAERRPVTDVAAWLRGLGLGRYEAEFRDNEVRPDVLPSLTAEDLKEIGVAAVGDRRRLLDAIAALRAALPGPSAGPPSDNPPE